MLINLLALLPILMIFLFLFLLKKSALLAGGASFLTAIVLVHIVPMFALDAGEMIHAALKGVLTSGIVAYVLLFGILLFHLMNEAGAIRAIASFVANITDDPVRQVLLLAAAFSPLVESASGFGIAIIVVAPILIELGFAPYRAALVALSSLSAVAWGALATGTVIGASLGGIPLTHIGRGSAVLCCVTFFYFIGTAVWIATGHEGIRKRWPDILVAAGTLSLLIWACNVYISVELAGVLGSLGTLGVLLLLIKLTAKGNGSTSESLAVVWRAASPYLFLTTLLLLSRLVPPVEAFLATHAVVDLPAYGFSLPLCYSPGFALFLTCLFSLGIYRTDWPTMQKILRYTWAQWYPVTLTTVFYVAMSEIMASSGMIATLAMASAPLFGHSFVFLSPFVGGLGGFLTGSTTGSNAMFMKLQVETGLQLGIPPEILASSQNTGASHLTMASPSRVVLGATVCKIRSEESRLQRSMTLIAAGSLTLVMLASKFFW
ncbi:L-lactate permease [Brevibacillus sp. SYP-B805]|nr:L-lactate permease [Brevibacillus sp. SYP-B805]